MNKFEAVDENALQIASNTSNTEDVKDMNLNSTCLCESENISSYCNDTELLNIVGSTNISELMMKKLIMLDDTVFLVLVSTDFISIYSYIAAEQQFYPLESKSPKEISFSHIIIVKIVTFTEKCLTGLYVPDILEVYMEPIDNSLWIVLRLSEETLILCYHAWNEFEQHVLSGSNSFVISKTPNNQYLLIRSDGIWNLGGVFRPEHIFKMSLEGQIETFALGANYYVKATTENNTTVLKARYVGN